MADLALLFGEVPHLVVGAWFLLDESLLIANRKRFSSHGNPRPVVLSRKPGPNALVLTRSTTAGAGTLHAKHPDRHSPLCCITKEGRIVDQPTFTVPSSLLNDDTFRCLEPEGSTLFGALKQVRS